ncbi:aspartate/glutamate racemase family protein [Enterovibrio makurazakiensis]|uniref:Aspartate/glutamate racemase family protein n=1 Tax=Enterovibrio gelatinilyticus TaxID=2899819 RepID=A0ABT5R4I4_9GAMM|nr:aspartate/glutamate racemase family protein [Enterovibrio sp. ZSDZ42]MDD1795168.1 aspartate/glutamate racemase family protein [Enterovibrio sp. ZSDZ42]
MKTLDEFKQFEIPLTYQPAPRINRTHIGLVQLSTDHSLEMDWAKLLGTQAAVFSSRVYYSSEMTPEALDNIANGIGEASDLIAYGLPMDVMAFGCTSATIIIGEERVGQLLTQNRGNIPTTNPWTAAKAAFKRLGAKKIAVFSPYPTDVNFPLYQQLTEAGFDVVRLGSLGIERDTDITTVSRESMLEALENMLPDCDADLVFMSCTNLRVLDHIKEIEDRFGIPVVCSNSAMFWHAMHLSGNIASCPGFGRLLNLDESPYPTFEQSKDGEGEGIEAAM